MEKLLITGASGLLGRHLVEKLCEDGNYQITAVISGRRAIDFPDAVLVKKANLLDPEECRLLFKEARPDVCCHLAWSLEDSSFSSSLGNVEWLETSLRILRLFAENGGSRFLFAGSSSEYGTGNMGNAECGGKESFSLYGNCKRAFEEAAGTYCKLRNIIFLSARYFSVYGPWDKRTGSGVPTAIRNMMSGHKFLCKAPNNLWDFVYVKDCAEATARLLHQAPSGSYNIATGISLPMRDYFSTVARLLGTEDLLDFAENNEQLSLMADVTKLKDEAGYCCTTSFEDGIKETIQWWRDHPEFL